MNQSDPIDNDLVVHSEPLLDDEAVLQLILDYNLVRCMCDVVFIDDVNAIRLLRDSNVAR